MKKYMELYREMRQDIVEGRYGFSERLPSKRYLSEEQGISLINGGTCTGTFGGGRVY